jgi:hypothetical protein
MGATLPVAIQVLQDFDRDLLRNVSSYYYMNTIGAAIGCFVAGTVLISLVGLDGTIDLAALLNLLLAEAILGFVRSIRSPVTEYYLGSAVLKLLRSGPRL